MSPSSKQSIAFPIAKSIAVLISPLLVQGCINSSNGNSNDNNSGGSLSITPASENFCTATATAMMNACLSDTEDDYWVLVAQCNNLSDAQERVDCVADAEAEMNSAKDECGEVENARLEVCTLVGEAPHAPDFSPSNFVDPDTIGVSVSPNPYFPIVPGTRWVYEGAGEVITVTVTNKTKLIDGVTCRVVSDIVTEDGAVIEDTLDWYAQDISGNVWYCGEIAQNFESFDGDNPGEAELVDIDGSFKVGRDGAKPGIVMLANPQVGDSYRQEVSLGDAEDIAEVISISATESVPAASCNNTCLVTRDFTPLEPGVNENKYYAPDVGTILEIDADGNRVELVEFTTP